MADIATPSVPDSTIQNTSTSGSQGYVNSSGIYTNPSPTAQPISTESLTKSVSPVVIPNANQFTPTTPTVTAPQGTTTGENGTATITPPSTSSSTDTQSWIRTQLANLGGALAGKSAAETQAQTDAGLTQKTTQATQDYNAYNQAKLDLAQKVADMRNNPNATISKQAMEENIADVQRKGNENLANLAVIAQSSQGLLAAAQKTINDKITAQFQPIQDQIDFLEKFSTVNNADLTESEKSQITANAAQLKEDSTAVQTALTDVHKTLLGANAPASAYSQLDQITNDYSSGKITAQEAQDRMDAIASPYAKNTSNTQQIVTNDDGSKSVITLDNQGNVIKSTNIGGGNGSGLTKTEISSGSVKAGLDETSFKALPPDAQAFFARATETQVAAVNKAISDIQSGTDVDTATQGLTLSPGMKTYLSSLATTTASNGGGGFMGWLKGLFSGGQQSSTANSTVMTGPDGKQYNVPNDKVASFKANGYK